MTDVNLRTRLRLKVTVAVSATGFQVFCFLDFVSYFDFGLFQAFLINS